MARQFLAASSQYLLNATQTPVTAVPLTIACWCYALSSASDPYVVWIGDASEPDQSFLLGINTATDVVMAITYAGTTSKADSTIAITEDVWQHYCAVFAAVDDRSVFLNGGNEGNDTGSRTPSGIDSISVGMARDSTPGHEYDGLVSELGVWNIDLTNDEVATLATGVSPLAVRPGNLVLYLPMVRDNDEDIVGGLSMSAVNGPTVAEHPRVIYPSYQMLPVAAVADGGLTITLDTA